MQDGFNLFELHGDTSVKFIIPITLLLALAKMLMWQKKRGSIGQRSTKLPLGNLIHHQMRSPINNFSPPLTNTLWSNDQRHLEIGMMEQQRLFELLFKTAVRQQNALRSLLPGTQIVKLPQEQGTMIRPEQQGNNPWEPQGRWDQYCSIPSLSYIVSRVPSHSFSFIMRQP